MTQKKKNSDEQGTSQPGKPSAESAVAGSLATSSASENRLCQVYPSGRGLFSIVPGELSFLCRRALIFLDTSCLLRPYSASSTGLEEIAKVLTRLSGHGRLRIAEHSAREFFSNRTGAVSKILQRIDSLKSKAQLDPLGSIPLISDTVEFRDLKEAEDALREAHERHKNALTRVVEIVAGWGMDDPVVQLYRNIFPESVVVPNEADPVAFGREVQRRFDSRIPPGFKDQDKEENRDGDLRVWMALLQHCKSEKMHAILVCDDLKSDWWERAGEKRLSPRYELIEEFHRETEGKSFAMLTFPQFLESFGASEEVVREAREADRLRNERMLRRREAARRRRRPINPHFVLGAVNEILELLQQQRHRGEAVEPELIQYALSRHLPDSHCRHNRAIKERIVEVLSAPLGSDGGDAEYRKAHILELIRELHPHGGEGDIRLEGDQGNERVAGPSLVRRVPRLRDEVRRGGSDDGEAC